MKKRVHILTVPLHRKLMVDPDQDWLNECGDPKYRERYFVALAPFAVNEDELAPADSKYQWPVLDTTGMKVYGKPTAYFTDGVVAKNWVDQENEKYPPPPTPEPPPSPFAEGTFYMLEARHYEIRQIVRQSKSGRQRFIGDDSEQPYLLVSGHRDWQEKFITKFDDRNAALAHLHKLIRKK